MYDIKVDDRTGLVEVKLAGLMTVEEVASYIADLTKTCRRPGLRSWALLLDVSTCPIQHQDVIVAMGTHMASMPKARSIAVVTGSSLAKMQIRRLFTQPYTRIVHSTAEARAWLLDGVEPAGSQPAKAG